MKICNCICVFVGRRGALWLQPSIAALSEADDALLGGFTWLSYKKIVSCAIAWCGQYWATKVCYVMSRVGRVWYSVIEYSRVWCCILYMYSVASGMASQGPIT